MIELGREITGRFEASTSREWLMTNGLGSWASGTVSGANTRRCHGLFAPSLTPPLGRTVLVSKFDEGARLGERLFPLSSNKFGDGTLAPKGYRHLEAFRLEGGIPTWTYALSEALLEKRVWRPHGQNTTWVTYTLRRTSRPVALTVKAFVAGRDAHAEMRADQTSPPKVEALGGSARIHAGAVEYSLVATDALRASPGRFWAGFHRRSL
jgi:predicted glycogen debranching enzyme